MTRFPDWERRFADFLAANADRPFAWGSWDCCLFAAGAVQAITGEDAMAEFRGRYRTKRGAATALGRIGQGTLAATMDAKFRAIVPGIAQRGDLVMVDGGLGVAFGAVSIHVGQEGEREGLVRHARPLWRRAWRVG